MVTGEIKNKIDQIWDTFRLQKLLHRKIDCPTITLFYSRRYANKQECPTSISDT